MKAIRFARYTAEYSGDGRRLIFWMMMTVMIFIIMGGVYLVPLILWG